MLRTPSAPRSPSLLPPPPPPNPNLSRLLLRNFKKTVFTTERGPSASACCSTRFIEKKATNGIVLLQARACVHRTTGRPGGKQRARRSNSSPLQIVHAVAHAAGCERNATCCCGRRFARDTDEQVSMFRASPPDQGRKTEVGCSKRRRWTCALKGETAPLICGTAHRLMSACNKTIARVTSSASALAGSPPTVGSSREPPACGSRRSGVLQRVTAASHQAHATNRRGRGRTLCV